MALKTNTAVFGTPVRIKTSGEDGTITGFCRHQRSKQPQFFVEYKGGDGRFTQDWFYDDQLQVML